MKLEIEIQELDKSNEPDWEAMGVKPKRAKPTYKYRRCLIDTLDIEYVKEYDDTHSIVKCVWMEESVVVLSGYDDIVIRINDIENANYEGDE